MKGISHSCFGCHSCDRNFPFPKCHNLIKDIEIRSGVMALVERTANNSIEFKQLTPDWAYACRMNPDEDCEYWTPWSVWQRFKVVWDDNLWIQTLKEGYWVNLVAAIVITGGMLAIWIAGGIPIWIAIVLIGGVIGIVFGACHLLTK